MVDLNIDNDNPGEVEVEDVIDILQHLGIDDSIGITIDQDTIENLSINSKTREEGDSNSGKSDAQTYIHNI